MGRFVAIAMILSTLFGCALHPEAAREFRQHCTVAVQYIGDPKNPADRFSIAPGIECIY
jgi:hypothetical protein